MNLVKTGDGSHTIFVPEYNEHYHSSFGAITESQHVFINTGLALFRSGKKITIFEIGFGTGLNALLSCIFAIENKMHITYYALEKNPVDNHFIMQLNYPAMVPTSGNATELFQTIHHAPWDQTITIAEGFYLHKIHADLVGYVPWFRYDLVYFDAFAPEKQPEMWSQEIFNALYHNLNPHGVITTYCVKGDVKRKLKQAGFQIQKLPGPPGKREILRGTRDHSE
jgi:tRNA U34 5-methylaminomethyl-2-thiouridine-forming methyltransferase MnmC